LILYSLRIASGVNEGRNQIPYFHNPLHEVFGMAELNPNWARRSSFRI